MAMRAPEPRPPDEPTVPSDLAPPAEADGTPEFVGYPDRHLMGIVPTVEAERLARDLQHEGLDAPHVFLGEQGVQALDSGGAEHGLFSGLMRAVEQTFSEIDHLGPYSTALREGDAVVAVPAEDEDVRARALECFRAHDGRFVNYFGAMTVELLLR
ncbi:MAG: hypothetical protein U0360_01580 [Dehalococcoidia bacterium]